MSNTNNTGAGGTGTSNSTGSPLTNNLGKLGGQLGVLLCLIGFIGIFLGWNGAASKNVIMAQFPFLISGGLAGLAIVVIGAAMLIVQNAREDRARLEATLEPGDLLFVPAGTVHRFEGFTDDLAVWVFFYGPEGGESEP